MSSNAKYPRNLFPPKVPHSKKTQKYRSPDPSPFNFKSSQQDLHENLNLKENLNLVTRVNRQQSISSTGPPLNPSSLYKEKNRENVENLEEFICKYHPALVNKNLQLSKQEHEKVLSQNKSLKQLIKKKQEEALKAIQEKRNEVNREIKKVENEIELLKLQLVHVKNPPVNENLSEIFRLVKENSEYEKSIVEGKVEIVAMREKGIKQEDFFLLQEKIVTLELMQNKLLDKNSELKLELKTQVANNFASKALSEQKNNFQNMWNIYSLILKLQKLSKKYIAHEVINLADLMYCDEAPENTTVSQIISQTRKEICNLRVLVSDIYAENCGVSCQSQ